MIIKYHPDRVYDPNAPEHRIRRAMKYTIERKYKYQLLESNAYKLLMAFPLTKKILPKIFEKAHKLIYKINGQRLISNQVFLINQKKEVK